MTNLSTVTKATDWCNMVGDMFHVPNPLIENITKQFFRIISLKPISKRSTSKPFHEPSLQFVRIDVIGTF